MNEVSFPLHVFPKSLRAIADDLIKTLGYHPDFLGSSLLVVAAAAIGKTRKLCVKDSWEQIPTIFLILVGPPGSGKTHPLAYCLKPLLKENERFFRRSIGNGKEDQFTSDQMMSLEVEEPMGYQVVISNFTIEAMHQVMQQGGDRLIIWSDEISGFLRNLNKYRAGGDVEEILSVYNGTDITVNRATRDNIYIKQPFACIAGSTQPGVLLDVFGKAVENGLRDRFLFAWPDNVAKPKMSKGVLGKETTLNYEAIIKKLLLFKSDNDGPKAISMTDEAFAEAISWFNYNAERVNNESNEKLQSAYSKLDFSFFRFALILHSLYTVCGEETMDQVGLRSVKSAKDVVEYYRSMSEKVIQKISPDPYDRMSEVELKVYKNLPDEFVTAIAKQVAEKNGMPERSLFVFLKNRELFKRLKYGKYAKLK